MADGPERTYFIESPHARTFVAFVDWAGNFDAVIYVLIDDCETACVHGERGEEFFMEFYAPQDLEHDFARFYFVVDGANGAEGSGTLKLEGSFSDPVQELTWGRIRSLYR
jgi:hypothetical protein